MVDRFSSQVLCRSRRQGKKISTPKGRLKGKNRKGRRNLFGTVDKTYLHGYPSFLISNHYSEQGLRLQERIGRKTAKNFGSEIVKTDGIPQSVFRGGTCSGKRPVLRGLRDILP
jgi:hypothetical protein